MNWKPLLLATATAVALAGCASPTQLTPRMDTPTNSRANQHADSSAATLVSTTSLNQGTVLDPLNDPNSPIAMRRVYFSFDSAVLENEYKSLVAAHAEYLESHAEHKVVIQGSTDARGSPEYNLALGQRRAETVKNAMETLGVPEKQLEAVSFGKEKPLAQGTTEADYAQNRRDDIVYETP